jgi:hypothetical protein
VCVCVHMLLCVFARIHSCALANVHCAVHEIVVCRFHKTAHHQLPSPYCSRSLDCSLPTVRIFLNYFFIRSDNDNCYCVTFVPNPFASYVSEFHHNIARVSSSSCRSVTFILAMLFSLFCSLPQTCFIYGSRYAISRGSRRRTSPHILRRSLVPTCKFCALSSVGLRYEAGRSRILRQ